MSLLLLNIFLVMLVLFPFFLLLLSVVHEQRMLEDSKWLMYQIKMVFKVARNYLYSCWLCFLFAFFRMKDSTDLKKCYLFSCTDKNL